MSHTQKEEGTLRVLPLLHEATAYIILRPFFRPRIEEAAKSASDPAYSADYLAADNWIVRMRSTRPKRVKLMFMWARTVRLFHGRLPWLLARPQYRAQSSHPSAPPSRPGHDLHPVSGPRRYGLVAHRPCARSRVSTPGSLVGHVHPCRTANTQEPSVRSSSTRCICRGHTASRFSGRQRGEGLQWPRTSR